MQATFYELQAKTADIDFDKIYDYIKAENNGEFVDTFSDNIESYISAIYGIEFDYDIDEIADINLSMCDDIYIEWQEYLETKEM